MILGRYCGNAIWQGQSQQHDGLRILCGLFATDITNTTASQTSLTAIKPASLPARFTKVLIENGIVISIDGCERALNNIPSASSGQALSNGCGAA
jgi:hypothetical protein